MKKEDLDDMFTVTLTEKELKELDKLYERYQKRRNRRLKWVTKVRL